MEAIKSSFSFSFKVFNAPFSLVVMILLFVLCTATAVLIAREYSNYPQINTYRLNLISALQTDAEKQEVVLLKESQAKLQVEVADLREEKKQLEETVATQSTKITQQAQQIANAMVIEKDLGEVYERRVKPKFVAAGDSVKGAYASVVSYTAKLWHNE